MNLSRYQLIITDLDGTLVEYGSDHLSPAVRDLAKRLRERGVIFTLATGRSWKQTEGIVRELGITAPVILQAGAIVFDPVAEKVIRLVPLRMSVERQLRSLIDFDEVDQFCLNESGGYFASTFMIKTGGGRWLHEHSGESCSVAGFESNQERVVKHLFIGPESAIKDLSVRIHREVKPKPNQILWPPDNKTYDWFLEVFDPSSSKGRALRWLAAALKVRSGRIMAFGDGFNDLDMLERAGTGIATAGAPDLVKAKADLIIPGPEEDGIPRFLGGEIPAVPKRSLTWKRVIGNFFS